MVSPVWAWLALFFVAPFAVVVGISLSRPRLGIPPYAPLIDRGAEGGVTFLGGLHNYALVFSDPYYVDAFLGSLRIASVSTAFCLLLGFPMAYAIARARRSWRGPLLLLVMLPFWTSFLIRIYAWIGLLNSNGLVNTALRGLGLIETPLPLLYSDFAVYVGIVYAYLPFMVLPIFAVLDRIDPDVHDAARDLGAGGPATFAFVTVPLALPGIVAGCLLVFAPALGEFVIPELLGGSDFLMIGRVLWTESFQNRDWPLAAAIAVVLLVVVVAPLLVVQHLERRGAAGGPR